MTHLPQEFLSFPVPAGASMVFPRRPFLDESPTRLFVVAAYRRKIEEPSIVHVSTFSIMQIESSLPSEQEPGR